jgi:hypothetical protein
MKFLNIVVNTLLFQRNWSKRKSFKERYTAFDFFRACRKSLVKSLLYVVANSDTEAELRDHVMWLWSRDVIKMTVYRAI